MTCCALSRGLAGQVYYYIIDIIKEEGMGGWKRRLKQQQYIGHKRNSWKEMMAGVFVRQMGLFEMRALSSRSDSLGTWLWKVKSGISEIGVSDVCGISWLKLWDSFQICSELQRESTLSSLVFCLLISFSWGINWRQIDRRSGYYYPTSFCILGTSVSLSHGLNC